MIRKIQEDDLEMFLEMSKTFYSSEAVIKKVPETNFNATFQEMMESDQYLQGYIFMVDKSIAGYAITGVYFSPEVGGLTLWIEEIFIKKEYRGQGLGNSFFNYIEKELNPKIKRIRLEVDFDNTRAIELYKRRGFQELAYKQMIKEIY